MSVKIAWAHIRWQQWEQQLAETYPRAQRGRINSDEEERWCGVPPRLFGRIVGQQGASQLSGRQFCTNKAMLPVIGVSCGIIMCGGNKNHTTSLNEPGEFCCRNRRRDDHCKGEH